MTKAKDLTGQVFGYLTAVKRTFNSMSVYNQGIVKQVPNYVCHCICGKEKIVQAPSLKRGMVRSCGCLTKEMSRTKFKSNKAKPRRDLTGQKFGRWTVMKFSGNKNNSGALLWNCVCECGFEKEVKGSDLTTGSSKSCGCLASELTKERTIGTIPHNRGQYGESSFNYLLADYKKQAKEKNNEWALSKEKFRDLVTGNCFYCGAAPTKKVITRVNLYGEFYYNGIDRLDNNKGYTEENSVSCCWLHNRMKREENWIDFLNSVFTITEYWNNTILENKEAGTALNQLRLLIKN